MVCPLILLTQIVVLAAFSSYKSRKFKNFANYHLSLGACTPLPSNIESWMVDIAGFLLFQTIDLDNGTMHCQ